MIEHRPWLAGIALILFVLGFTGTGLAMLLDHIRSGWVLLLVGLGIGIGAFVVIVVAGTAHPLTPCLSDHPKHKQIAQAINAWLSAPGTA